MTRPVQYYTAAAVRELDRLAIEEHHIPGFELMQRAGKAAFRALRQEWPQARHLLVLCGTGNNGGDGLLVAGLAVEAGLPAEVWIVGNAASINGDARKALEFAQARAVPIQSEAALPDFAAQRPGTVIVDALLGTGLAGDVRAPWRQAIDAINRSTLPVLAIDIPSGLCSDTGKVLGASVKADLTVTFIGRKLGLVEGAGPLTCGKVVFDDLGVPAEIYRRVAAAATR